MKRRGKTMPAQQLAKERDPRRLTQWGTPEAELQGQQAKEDLAAGRAEQFATLQAMMEDLRRRREARREEAEQSSL
jgi:hypothetical protein